MKNEYNMIHQYMSPVSSVFQTEVTVIKQEGKNTTSFHLLWLTTNSCQIKLDILFVNNHSITYIRSENETKFPKGQIQILGSLGLTKNGLKHKFNETDSDSNLWQEEKFV